MSNLAGRRILVVLSLGVLTLLSACKGQKIEPIGALNPAMEAAQKLPEGTNILAALDRKDYDAAITGLAALRQVAGEGELAPQFLTLKLYVKARLQELSTTDPKAGEALSAMRSLTSGR